MTTKTPAAKPNRSPAPLIAPDVNAAELFAHVERVFADLFEIRRLVAASHERALFVVRDKVLKRIEALRVHYQPDSRSRRWFERETELYASLDHANLRPIYTAGYRESMMYRVVKWIEGESLEEAVGRGPRPIPDVLRLARELSGLLEYVHSNGITARYIVPTSLMLEATGRIYVIDLRFASSCLDVILDDWDEPCLPFLAPEIRDRSRGDAASDIYTAGAILYYAVTGVEPALDPDNIIPPQAIRAACPQVLQRIIIRALEASPLDRFLSAAEMRDDLLSHLGDFETYIPVAPPLGAPGEDSRGWEQRLRRALGDDYELLLELGSGGYGRVYRVRDLALEREVALKVLHPYLTADPEVVERFHREAQVAGRLMHSHIVNTYDFGGRAGLLWYTMEYVPGGSLGDVVRSEGPMSLERVTRFLSEALEALEYAHDLGLVHRDLKPENILLHEQTGDASIADFGLALALQTDAFGGATSQSGTPEYAAPEQLLGERVDHRVDLYSLTLCAYYALTGTSPFTGDSVASIIARQQKGELPNLQATRKDVPVEFQRVLMKGAASAAEDRYLSASEYSRALKDSLRRGVTQLFRWMR